MKRVLLISLAFYFAHLVHGQTTRCTNNLKIATGWNYASNSLLSSPTDPYWSISGGTSGPNPNIIAPFTPHWNVLPNSQWLSPYPSYTGDANTTYTYTFKFCMKGEPCQSNPLLNLQVLSDNDCVVKLNGNTISSSGIYFKIPVNVSTTNCNYFLNGVNTITFEVYNVTSPTGLNVSGQFTSLVNAGVSIGGQECCNDKCIQIENISTRCNNSENGNTFKHCINITNNTSHTINKIDLFPLNGSISPTSFTVNIPPFGTKLICFDIFGLKPMDNFCYKYKLYEFEEPGVVNWICDDNGMENCIVLPKCPCFDVIDSYINCDENASPPVKQFCFSIFNNSGHTIHKLKIASVGGSAIVSPNVLSGPPVFPLPNNTASGLLCVNFTPLINQSDYCFDITIEDTGGAPEPSEPLWSCKVDSICAKLPPCCNFEPAFPCLH